MGVFLADDVARACAARRGNEVVDVSVAYVWDRTRCAESGPTLGGSPSSCEVDVLLWAATMPTTFTCSPLYSNCRSMMPVNDRIR